MSSSVGLPAGLALLRGAPGNQSRNQADAEPSEFSDLLSPRQSSSDRDKTLDQGLPEVVGLLQSLLPPAPSHGEISEGLKTGREMWAESGDSVDFGTTVPVCDHPATVDADPAVIVLESEVHHEPVRPSAPPRAHFDELAREAVALRDAGLPVHRDSPVRMLSIELRPADLGILHVRMRMASGRLEVSIDASRPEAARWLSEQTVDLAGVLRSVGYELADVDIKVASRGNAWAPEPQPERGRGVVRSVEQRQGAIEAKERLRRGEADDVADGVADRGGVYL